LVNDADIERLERCVVFVDEFAQVHLSVIRSSSTFVCSTKNSNNKTLFNIQQDATLTQGPPRDAPNIWVPWK